MADNKKTGTPAKKTSRRSNYNDRQQKAIDDSIRAIKKYYGEDVDPKIVNSILGNIELETQGFTKLKEDAWSTGNFRDRQNDGDYKSIIGNYNSWGKGDAAYIKLSKPEKLSVMYFGDTENGAVAGGQGSLHLTAANYGGIEETPEELRKTAEDLGLDYNTINDSFYDSTLATIHLYDKYRGQDFAKYNTPQDLRKSVINPGENLNPEKKDHKTKIDILTKYNEDPFDTTGKVVGDQSVNPELITSNKDLDKGAQEELLKVNESQGVEKSTAEGLTQQPSMLNQYMGGYNGATNLSNFLNEQDISAKKQKAKQNGSTAAGQQQEGPQNKGQESLGYTGDISSFDPKFNLLDQEFNKGGDMNSEPGANVLTEYNKGGSHEQNPQGGIPVGPNSQGGQNLVEQGETRHNDYIYSNEYKLSKKDVSRFGLSPKYEGKSYSDVSKEINEQMTTRPYDRLVKQTAEGSLNKLMLAQETVKQEEAMAAAQKNGGLMPQGENQEFNFGGAMQIGATQDALDQINKKGEVAGPGAGAYVQAVTGAAGLAQDAFGPSTIDSTGASGRQQAGSLGGAAASGAMKGASAGMAFGPWGAAIGGAVGAGAGLLGGAADQKAALQANRNAGFIENNAFTSEDAVARKGGLLDTHLEHGGSTHPPRSLGQFMDFAGRVGAPIGREGAANFNEAKAAYRNLIGLPEDMGRGGEWEDPMRRGGSWDKFYPDPGLTGDYQPSFKGVDEVNDMNMPQFYPGITDFGTPQAPANGGVEDFETEVTARPRAEAIGMEKSPYMKIGSSKKEQSSTFNASSLEGHQANYKAEDRPEAESANRMRGPQFDELLRYAPSVGNLARLLTLPDAEKESYDRLDQRYKPQYADEMAMQNIVSQGAANNRSAIQNASGGSQAATRASLLGSQVNEQRAMSEAYMQMDNINRAEDGKAQEFNGRIDQYNQQVGMQETIANAQNRAARDSQKDSLLSGLLNDAGAIGKEAKLARILENTTDYKTDGTKRGADDQVDRYNRLGNMFKKKGGALDIARILWEK